MRRSIYIFVCLFVFTSVFLVACKNKSDDSRTKITMWNRHSDLINYLPEIIESFEQEHTDIKVELTNLPVENQEAQYQAAIQEKTLPDIFTLGGGYGVPDLVSLDLIQDLEEVLTEELQNQYSSGSFAEGKTMMNDKVYVLPIYSPAHGAFMMYYNKDLLKDLEIEKDPPKSWDELMEIGKEVYEKSEGNHYGLLIGMKADWLISDATLQMARAITPETEMDWKTGEYNYTTKGLIKTIDFYKKMLDEDILSIQSLELGAQDVYTQFANGMSAFMFAGNYVGTQLYERGLESFGVMNLPTKNNEGFSFGEKSVIEGITVSKHTEHWDEVKVFLNYLMDHLYPYIVESGASAPAKKLEFVGDGEVKSNLPQFNDIAKIMEEAMIVYPNPANVNLDTIPVDREYGEMAPKEGLDSIVIGYLSNQIRDLEKVLQEYTDKHNKALIDAIEKTDGKVTKDDYTFPNWDPPNNYTDEDYEFN